jgi:hypothetical protein
VIVETHNELRDPQRIECTRVVVRDRFDQPVAVLLEPAPGQIWVSRRGEPRFEQALELLGIRDTVVRTHIIGPPQKPLSETELVLP